MAWSQSDFLQALGWSTLNSFWQMGLLWTAYLLFNYFFRPSSSRKYLAAVALVFTGTGWFIYTFAAYYLGGSFEIAAFRSDNIETSVLLPRILTAASLTYLALLVIPAYKVFRNWQYLQLVKKTSTEKAPLKNRLFVQQIAALLGIKKQVRVFISELVTSPVTVGYLKPVILLPFTVLTQLSPQQLEAILVHELTHIRRHDYLINLLLTAVNVILYFNPFIRNFLSSIEAERENCCDELVLQFGYDKISYASALLQLEKNNHTTTALAMSATNKNNLLTRIEKIVGVKKKPKVTANHLFGAFAALMILFTINSLIIAGKESLPATSDAIGFSQPVSYLPAASKHKSADLPRVVNGDVFVLGTTIRASESQTMIQVDYFNMAEEAGPEVNPGFQQVAFDEIDASLTAEEKERVKTTLSSTKKVLKSKWNDVEQTIADGMNKEEKIAAKNEYLYEIENLDWKRMEQNMKASYENMDWNRIQSKLALEMHVAQLDSIKQNYKAALAELDKMKLEGCKITLQPMPDASLTEVKKAREMVEARIKEINNIKERKIIKL